MSELNISEKQDYPTYQLDIPSMLEHGLHLGHLSRFWNPKMKDYIFKVRYGVHIINLVKTEQHFKRALSFAEKIVSKGGKILFVGTKATARDIVAQQADRCGMPYVNHRWLGGMMTNFKTVKDAIARLKKITEMEKQGLLDKLTKKEALMKRREVEKLEKILSGIKKLNRLPDALFVVDVGYEDIAVKEANKLGIPVIGLVDTNNNPDDIQFPIPANDDAIRAITYSISLFAQVIDEARSRMQESQKQEARQMMREVQAPSQNQAAPKKPVKDKEVKAAPSAPAKAKAAGPVKSDAAPVEAPLSTADAGISAQAVKALREQTGAGMMECKKALVEAQGDIEKAKEILEKSGQKKVAKSASRTAAEGVVDIIQNNDFIGLVEVNCETDFVARDEYFQQFRDQIKRAAVRMPSSLEELLSIEVDNATLAAHCEHAITKLGEKIVIRRCQFMPFQSKKVGFYSHGGKIAAIVVLKDENEQLARDLAMHIAAMKPSYVSYNDVPAQLIERQREIFQAQVAEENKPQDIKDKIVEGKIQKHFGQECLLEQSFVKNPDQTIQTLLKSAKTSVASFIRFEVGEGIEKQVVNFAEEVMKQVNI